MDKIPKIIHYCWLSGDEMPQRLKDCVESWRTVMPDYEIMLWNMDRFNVHSVPWVEQACSVKKWAFAADYIRLYTLYNYGGIYLDADVRAIKSFDPFLKHRAFSGVEWSQKDFYYDTDYNPLYNTGVNIEMAIIGAEQGHPVIKAFKDYYEGRNFIENDRTNETLMPAAITPIAEKFGFNKHDYWSHQVLEGDFHIYPYDFFPGQYTPMWDMFVSHNTVAIHLHTWSWFTPREPVPADILHHPYTEWRLLTGQYFRDIWHKSFSRIFKKYDKRREKYKEWGVGDN